MSQNKLDLFNQFVQGIPAKTIENPYWKLDETSKTIQSLIPNTSKEFDVSEWAEILGAIRIYFRNVYDAFGSEAQVLCIDKKDAHHFYKSQIPHLPGYYVLGDIEIMIFVLPQHNSFHITNVSEAFWQTDIVAKGITPVARIHSHHILDPYQSPTDYASLNSNTLEMVLGHIYDDLLDVGYWLDVQNTNAKDNVWVATELPKEHDYIPSTFTIREIPCGNLNKTNQIKGEEHQKERN